MRITAYEGEQYLTCWYGTVPGLGELVKYRGKVYHVTQVTHEITGTIDGCDIEASVQVKPVDPQENLPEYLR